MLDKNGDEIQLSTLCNEDDVPQYSGKPLDDLSDLGDFQADDDELRKSFQFEDENGDVIPDEEDISDEAFFDGDESFDEDDLF